MGDQYQILAATLWISSSKLSILRPFHQLIPQLHNRQRSTTFTISTATNIFSSSGVKLQKSSLCFQLSLKSTFLSRSVKLFFLKMFDPKHTSSDEESLKHRESILKRTIVQNFFFCCLFLRMNLAPLKFNMNVHEQI